MKILICDDEQTYLNTLHIHIEEYMTSHHIPCTITALTDPLQIQKDTALYDLAFLDIQMPGIDGIALAKCLRKNNPKLALFFVTNYDEYQDDALDLQAFRFYEKPLMLIVLTQQGTRCSNSSGQTQEQLVSGGSSVEAEAELIHVALQFRHSTMIGSHQKGFKVADNGVKPV